MELTNDFRVSVPPAQAWKVFTDVERIAPLLPGAQLQEIEGDEFRGIVKVKVGPIQAQYKGVATFLEQDEPAGKVVLKANGRDTRGQGNANATITATMVADGDGTRVSVVTDLTVTGKVAQFGRGVLADVSGKLIGQFVDALEADLEKGDPGVGDPAPGDQTPSEPAVVPSPADASSAPTAVASSAAPVEGDATSDGEIEGDATSDGEIAGDATSGGEIAGDATSDGESAPRTTGVRRIDSPEPEPVDLLDAAGGSVAKRAIPAVGVLAAVVLFVVLRRRAKSRRSERIKAALPSIPSLSSLSSLEAPSWDDVRSHLPDPAELRSLGRKAAKRAAKQAARAGAQAAKVGALAVDQVEQAGSAGVHAGSAGVEAAGKVARRNARAAAKKAARAQAALASRRP